MTINLERLHRAIDHAADRAARKEIIEHGTDEERGWLREWDDIVRQLWFISLRLPRA